MSIFAVTYSYGGPTETLNEHRPAHRAYLGELAQQGKIMGSGPFTDQGAAGALLVFSAESAEEVRAILAEDPLVIQGVVTDHSVREWSINTGTWS
ncbi:MULTISPECIES: YciI family protein [Kocuria]|uniref:YCII-related domain-containing protein n=1 Tax=Kocuria gwangalliensis TaxID=501592 RepID=A0ABP8WX97_9MICC|nr:YciI family protein [Kocuria sp.]MDO5366824.1 YciI family protein [Kocuria sp.]